jgi:dTDP-4-dehydrorhamnose reductase
MAIRPRSTPRDAPDRPLAGRRRLGRRRLLFVTGGAGYLGRHIGRGLEAESWSIVAPPSRSLDLRHRDSVFQAVKDWKPTAIIHTAYRRDDPTAIVDTTRHVAEAAMWCGARLVHVSTDLVFKGRPAPYTEDDEPTPIEDYGRAKADAERVVATLCPDALVVRTSLLYGRGPEPSPHELAVQAAIEGRSSMRFFTDEVRCPALVEDVAAALTQLAATPELTGVLHLAGPDALSRADLAMMTARRHGWDTSRLRLGTIVESGLDRPDHVVLDSSFARSQGFAVRGPSAWFD